MGGFRRIYGAHPVHLVLVLAAIALTAYAVAVVGIANLFTPGSWWQSIAVWFAVAIIAHDLILFPLYALADWFLPARVHRSNAPGRVALINFLRFPTLAAGLLFLMFFPGIIEQGADAFRSATGLTQAPYLTRWLLLTAALYLVSAVCYLVKTVVRQRRSARPEPEQAYGA